MSREVVDVLIVGSGGREVEIARTINRQNPDIRISCAPGNGGMHEIACKTGGQCYSDFSDPFPIRTYASLAQPDLIIIGPEKFIACGLTDELRKIGLNVVGPSQAAFFLEGSKAEAKWFMSRHNIPTAPFRCFEDSSSARRHIQKHQAPLVIKADGLCAGKGVFVCDLIEDACQAVNTLMVAREFDDAGNRIIIEERLEGFECSFTVLTDGKNVVPLLPAVDYKRRSKGDKGSNTGGMGAYCPDPKITPLLWDEIMAIIVMPTIRGMAYDGVPYTGVLYFGLMITESGPKVLEFNCRFGDPETQVILPLLESGLYRVLSKTARGDLSGVQLAWNDQKAVCVVVVNKDYPAKSSQDAEVAGIDEAKETGAIILGAGTKLGKPHPSGHGHIQLTNGGRIANCIGIAPTFEDAKAIADRAARCIKFEGADFRPDIAENVGFPT